MAKIAIPAQEKSENLENSLYFCALIEKINLKNPFVDIVGYNYKRSSAIVGNSSSFHTMDRIIQYIHCICIITCIFSQ